MSIAIITAIYDDYDSLKPILPQSIVDVDWVCVTDKPIADPQGWRVIVEPRPGQHPNVAAKRPKMLPWEYTAARCSVWVDASFRIYSEMFASNLFNLLHGGIPIAQFKHPWRDCIYDEAAASTDLAKYRDQKEIIHRQMARAREHAHPEHWGLWATGVIGRRHAPEVQDFGKRWLRTCQEWSFQDQLSEAVHLRDAGLCPHNLSGNHLTNPWLSYEGSSRH
jgi:hypothetical protein